MARASGGCKTANGLLIAGFFFYTVVALIVSLQKWADAKLPEKIINIVLIILLILAGQKPHAQRKLALYALAGGHASAGASGRGGAVCDPVENSQRE